MSYICVFASMQKERSTLIHIPVFIRPKKTCLFPISYRPCSIFMLLKVFWRGIRKNFTKNTLFSNFASHNHVVIFRIYFCNSIINLNDATTYLI